MCTETCIGESARELSGARARLGRMRWIDTTHTLELTARNIAALTDKLDDPQSARSLRSGCGSVMVTATESPGAAEAVAAPGTLPLTRAQLEMLAVEGASVTVAGITVVAVPDAAHYSDRPAGAVYMPSRREYR